MFMTKFGFLTMAFGADKYVRQAENMALSLERHMPGFPRAIVTDREVDSGLFDVVVAMDSVLMAGTIYKLTLYKNTAFDETFFIDSDCIVTRPFQQELTEIRQYEFTPVVSRYLLRGEHDLWLVDVAAALDRVRGKSFPKFNGGIYFFKQGNLAQHIFSRANELRNEAEHLGIKDFDRAGPGDETLIGLALAELNVLHLYDDHGKLMRTPLNITGSLHVDALGGGCSFNKEGTMVTPAICHFCGEWVLSPEYKIAEYSLRNKRKPDLIWRSAVKGRHHFERFSRKLLRA
jgi:hypothetical protein